MKPASLIVLAYERPEFLRVTMESLLSTPSGYPMEIIVHNDGSKDQEVFSYISDLAMDKKITMFINNCGSNQGIEKAVKRSIACSSGDYLVKLDCDLTFTENWLKRGMEIITQHKEIAALGLIDYRKYDPNDNRFWGVREEDDYLDVDDFVSSAYIFPREVFNRFGNRMSHDGWHLYLKSIGFKIAIKDVVNNFGFGRSIYVGPDGQAVKMDNEPLTF